MEKHYFSLRHLNINLCDLFISPDVPLQSRLHQLSNSREPQLYFLSARLVNCSFLISKNPSEGDLFSLICSSSKVPKFYPDLKTQNAAAAAAPEEQLFLLNQISRYRLDYPQEKMCCTVLPRTSTHYL